MRRLLLPVLLLLGALPGPADAAPVTTPSATGAAGDVQALDAAARDFRAIDLALTTRTSVAERRALHARALAVEKVVAARTADLQAQLAATQARLAQLAPMADTARAPAGVRAQRSRLEKQRAPLNADVQRARQLASDTARLIAATQTSPTDVLVEQLSARAPSPVTPDFWHMLGAESGHDAGRVALLAEVAGDTIANAHAADLWSLVLGLVAALAILFPLRIRLRDLGRRLMVAHAPADRLRKSGQAIWMVVSDTALPTVAAACAVAGARGAGLLAPAWEPLADALIRAAGVAGLVCGLGRALLMRGQPQWRLMPITDDAADALRPWSWAAAAMIFGIVMLDGLRVAAGLGAAARTGNDALIAALHIGFATGLLLWIGRLRLRAIARGDALDDGAGETGTALGSLLAWIATVAAAGALLLGYVGLAAFVARLLIWLPLVLATLSIALIFADDVSTGLVSQHSALGLGLHRGFGIRASLIDQAGVFLSAMLRLALLVLGLTLATGPFGSNVGSLLDQLGRVANGITIGQVTISPGAVLRSVVVLIVGLFVARGARHWLTQRYLPVTDLDAGARNSIATVAGYVGSILAVLWALASLGIGVERIALLLSALSVGIGFGLQAITQNFVSGLILLVERPVKIGDLIRVGDQEGDVKRISVRATEIQIADRSTLIVPNSELITKTVRNMTLADPIGRVQLQFSVGIGADVARVREMLMGMYAASDAVLDDPAPRVFVDSIADGRVNVNSFAYVASPRDVYPTRSELLFRLLSELPAAGIDLGTAPQQLQLVGGAAPTDGAAAVSPAPSPTPASG
jgi:small-conductance mechanosensitive channel